MKRRPTEFNKIRRTVRKSRITDSIVGKVASLTLIIRFLFIWITILALDTFINFRLEFLWPVWLLMKDTYEVLKYQGLEVTIVLTGLTIITDFLSLIIFPTRWLLFTASTYNCIQFACFSDRLNIATLFIWLLFVYNEATVRISYLPIHIELCRPLAAHSIGYSLVTIGLGMKNYFKYEIIKTKQQQVQRENDVYMQLVGELTPSNGAEHSLDNNVVGMDTEASNSSLVEKLQEFMGWLGSTVKLHGNRHIAPKTQVKSYINDNKTDRRKDDYSVDKDNKNSDKKNVNDTDSANISKIANHTNDSNNGSTIKNSNEQNITATISSTSSKKSSKDTLSNENLSINHSKYHGNQEIQKEKISKSDSNQENKDHQLLQDQVASLKARFEEEKANRLKACSAVTNLENEIKKVKLDLQQKENIEHDLRQQLSLLETLKLMESASSKGDLLSSSNRNRSSSANSGKDNISKRSERKSKVEAACQKKGEAISLDDSNHNNCRTAQANLEKEKNTLSSQLIEKEEQLKGYRQEYEIQRHQIQNEISKLKKELETLKSTNSSLQEKNKKLEKDLKSETRIKMDMFEHMGCAKHEKEQIEAQLQKRDREIQSLQAKVVELMAVGGVLQPPSNSSTSFASTELPSIVTASSHFISHARPMVVNSIPPNSLDPNRYPPTSSGHMDTDLN